MLPKDDLVGNLVWMDFDCCPLCPRQFDSQLLLDDRNGQIVLRLSTTEKVVAALIRGNLSHDSEHAVNAESHCQRVVDGAETYHDGQH
jgi:hypothetical protein